MLLNSVLFAEKLPSGEEQTAVQREETGFQIEIAFLSFTLPPSDVYQTRCGSVRHTPLMGGKSRGREC